MPAFSMDPPTVWVISWFLSEGNQFHAPTPTNWAKPSSLSSNKSQSEKSSWGDCLYPKSTTVYKTYKIE